jgi:hypothetical protein
MTTLTPRYDDRLSNNLHEKLNNSIQVFAQCRLTELQWSCGRYSGRAAVIVVARPLQWLRGRYSSRAAVRCSSDTEVSGTEGLRLLNKSIYARGTVMMIYCTAVVLAWRGWSVSREKARTLLPALFSFFPALRVKSFPLLLKAISRNCETRLLLSLAA